MPATRAAYKTTEVLCNHCGTRFMACRASAKYCGEACKQRAKRDRGFQTVAKNVRELVHQAEATPDPGSCRSCGNTGIVKDEADHEYVGGAHVSVNGLCWFCYKQTPEGEEAMTKLQARE